MKQLNALGARRQFFRGPHHRLRPLLLPAMTDDLLEGHTDLYVTARQPPTFAYFAGDLNCPFYIIILLLLLSIFSHLNISTSNTLTDIKRP